MSLNLVFHSSEFPSNICLTHNCHSNDNKEKEKKKKEKKKEWKGKIEGIKKQKKEREKVNEKDRIN